MLFIYKTIQKNKSDLKSLLCHPLLLVVLSDLPHILHNSLPAANIPFASFKVFSVTFVLGLMSTDLAL